MMSLLVAATALGLAVTGLRVLQKHGRTHIFHALSLFIAAAGVADWPTATALAVDRAAGIAGLGHIMTDSLVPLSFLLQFRFASRMRTTATWTSRRRLVFWGGVGLVLLHAGAWAICNHTLSGDHTHLWYNHYNGRPTRLLATYALLSASILYASLSCLYGYAPSLRADRPRGERLTAMGISGIAVGGVVYSPLIVGQAIASATGHGASAVTAWTEPIMASTALIALVTVLGLLFGPRVAAAIAARTQVDLPEQRRVLDQIRQESEAQARRHAHLANLAIAIDERLMHVRQDYAAAVAVETATRICVEHGIPVERRKVAREAVRILTLSYDNVVEAPFYDDDEIGERAGLAPYYLMHADGSYFFDDVYKVCYLAVGAHGLSSDIDESEDIDIEPWHRELGTIVAHALATYKKRSA